MLSMVPVGVFTQMTNYVCTDKIAYKCVYKTCSKRQAIGQNGDEETVEPTEDQRTPRKL